MTREEAARMCEAVVKPTFGTITSNDNNDAYKEAFEMAIAALRGPEWVRTVDRLPEGDEHKEMLALYKGSNFILYDIVQIGWLRLHPEMYIYWTHLPEKPEAKDEHREETP
jgi:hypothetical protein